MALINFALITFYGIFAVKISVAVIRKLFKCGSVSDETLTRVIMLFVILQVAGGVAYSVFLLIKALVHASL